MKIGKAVTEAEVQACFAVRRAVFIEEQNIAEAEEWDDLDRIATHLLAQDAEGPAGAARMIGKGEAIKIGRVAVLPQHRGTGLGLRIMEVALEVARADGFGSALLESQVHALAFYEKLGFVAEGPEYDDGSGILHRLMRRTL